jgi:hypothetical protein
MNFVELILQNKLDEAKELIYEKLDEIASIKLEEVKPFVVDEMFVWQYCKAYTSNNKIT